MVYFIGVDVGSGSARACLINEQGDIKSVATHPTTTWNPHVDHYEQSTQNIWAAIGICTRRILTECDVDANDVKGIGFDATCSLAVIDRSGRPLSVASDFGDPDRNVILWMDHRAREQTDRINATRHKVLQFQGGTMSLEMEVPKILWLKDNMPAEVFRQCKFYDLADFLVHKATEVETRSFCSLVCKLAYVPEAIEGCEDGWQSGFLRNIGLDDLADDLTRLGGCRDGKLNVVSAGECVGGLTKKAALELGLIENTSVGSGVIDAYAGWIGTVAAKATNLELLDPSLPDSLHQVFHRIAVVSGTSTCHLVMAPHPIFTTGVWGPYKNVLIPNHWVAEGGQSATGSLIKYVITSHPAYAKALSNAETEQLDIYTYLNRVLEQMQSEHKSGSIAQDNRHIYVYPDFTGNRSPLADASLRGIICGLTMESGVEALAQLYFAAIEAIAHQTRHIIGTLNNHGHNIQSIFMSGGQCKNKFLVQTISDATHLPVVIPHYIDAAVCLGAAMLGAKAWYGNANTLWEIMSLMSKEGSVIRPTKDDIEVRLYNAKYKIFLEMAEHQKRNRDELDAVIQA